jgi:predicted GNAT family N-acyltransferase
LSIQVESNTEKNGLTIKRFRREEAPADFERAIALRTRVFVDEQQVPIEEERDHYDDEATHWLVEESATGEAVATGRMISYQEGCQMRPVAKIGRIAVTGSRRGQRLGDWVMREILKTVAAEGYDQAILDAQTRVIPFYEKLGFVVEGDEFMDANIPHFRMRLTIR